MHDKIRVRFVDLGKQYLSLREEILNEFDSVSSKGSYILTEKVREFERAAAEYCGAGYAVGVGNCTDAIFLALKALGIGKGDEVITAPNSFIASSGAIVSAGATPVFADVADDYNINPAKAEQAITGRTRAIMPVHLTGRPADMARMVELAEKHRLFIIEDAAQAIGAEYDGKRVGSFGHAACFSMHPLKNLHAHGDAGFITTSDRQVYDRLLKLRNHGLKNRDECEFFGYNSRLDAIHAAICLLKLRHLDKWTERVAAIADEYKKELGKFVSVPRDRPHEKAVYHNFVIRTGKRDELQQHLLEKGIETKIHYPIPIHLQQAAASLGYARGDFPECERQASEILSLPIYPELSDQEVRLVVSAIRSFFT